MLNTEKFVVLAGNPENWDRDLQDQIALGRSLPAAQVDQYRRGRKGGKLVKTMDGWGVRAISNLQEPAVIVYGRFQSQEQAIEAGKRWANEDPQYREFIALKSDLEGSPEH